MEGSLSTTQPIFGLPEEIALQIFQDYLAFRRRELLARCDLMIRLDRALRSGSSSPIPYGRGQFAGFSTIASN